MFPIAPLASLAIKGLAFFLFAAPAAAQTPSTGSGQGWPAKPIRFIVAQAPGGQIDVQARLIGQKLSEVLGQPVVFDKLRALAVTTAQCSPALPEVATVAESGYPAFESGSWQGRVTRAGAPQAIIARLNSEVVKILRVSEVRNPMTSQGNDVIANSPDEFLTFIRREMEKWGKVIKSAGVRSQ